MHALNPSGFKQAIGSKRFSLVFFTQETCTPCAGLHPVLKYIEDEYPKIDFYFYDVGPEKYKEIPRGFKVKYLPRVLFFKDGKEVGRFWGPRDRNQLRLLLNKLLETGELWPDKNDPEAVTELHKKVQKALDFKFTKETTMAERTAAAEKLMSISEEIIELYPKWGTFSQKTVAEKVNLLEQDPT